MQAQMELSPPNVAPGPHVKSPDDLGPRPYDERYYTRRQPGARASAGAVVPHVIDLIHPTSVIDLGCGTGDWLAAFREHGISDVLGIDGGWVPRAHLQIPHHLFLPQDLCSPVHLERKFDLAVSLETAEHLSPACAPILVASLVSLAPIVLFSAAVPGQAGVDHQNLQWPRYWSELFARHGYVTIDCIRPRICDEPEVKFWYVQNTLLFAERSSLKRDEFLRAQFETYGGPPSPRVHRED